MTSREPGDSRETRRLATHAPIYGGSDSASQSIGLSGHCDRCTRVGHLKARPRPGCAYIGCVVNHEQPAGTQSCDQVRALIAVIGGVDGPPLIDGRAALAKAFGAPRMAFPWLPRNPHVDKGTDMETIQNRAAHHRFIAFPDHENMPTIFQRVEQLLTSGRSFTLIDYYINKDPDPHLNIAAGLRLEEGQSSLRRWQENTAERTRGFRFNFTRARGFGLFVTGRSDEATLARRYHEKQTATMITIQGRGDGVEDYVETREWNEYGVQVVIRIQLEDRDTLVAS